MTTDTLLIFLLGMGVLTFIFIVFMLIAYFSEKPKIPKNQIKMKLSKHSVQYYENYEEVTEFCSLQDRIIKR